MPRIGVSAAVFALILVGFVPSSSRSDDPPKVDAKTQEVDRILTAWQERSAKITSLKVGFRSTQSSPGFGSEYSAGWLYLALPNLALVDLSVTDDKGKPTLEGSRFVWTGQASFRFIYELHLVTRYNYAEEMTRPPQFLSLYFLLGMTVEQAKSDHEWSIVRETDSELVLRALARHPDDRWFLKNKPLVQSFEITLDKKTFLPKMVYVFDDKSRQRTVFQVTDLHVNPELNLEVMRNPKTDGWKVQENGPQLKLLKKLDEAIGQKK